MNPAVVGEQVAMLLWDVGEGLAMLTLKLWCKQHGAKQAGRRLAQQFQRLEKRRLLTREQQAQEIVFRLTSTGRQAALGGRDPVTFWNRPATKCWYLMVFDLPKHEQATRQRLLRWLRRNGFGYLQDSVWISPDSPAEIAEALDQFRDDVEALTILESRCAAGYEDNALVHGAWRFDAINGRYRALIAFCEQRRRRWKQQPPLADAVGDTLDAARKLWLAAATLDPLLPRSLWPDDYQGERALNALRGLRDAARAALRLPVLKALPSAK